jgi:hypothetical protein
VITEEVLRNPIGFGSTHILYVGHYENIRIKLKVFLTVKIIIAGG